MSAIIQNTAGLSEIATVISGNTATVVVSASSQAQYVPRLNVNETAGATPNLTVELYSGTTSYYLGSGGSTWTAKAVTAKQSVSFTDIVVPKGWSIRVTSSSVTGGFTCEGIKASRVG